MANFIIAIDPDNERRMRFAEMVLRTLPPVAGLCVNSLAIGDMFAGWAAIPSAPVTWFCDGTSASIEWGQPTNEGGGAVEVSELKRLWSTSTTRAEAFFNGYYAAAVFSIEGGLAVGADLLGIYPVYYWSCGDVLLVGSSPELFRKHPLFSTRLDARGLAAVMLTMHIFGGNTIMEGVRRLGAGNMLLWDRHHAVSEVRQYRIRVSTDRFDLPFSSHVDALDEAIQGAVRRCLLPGRDHQLMLSGGLDSRMLGAYLREQGTDAGALTLGISTDIEMRVAEKVAASLGFAHHGIEVAYDEYTECAARQARWECVSNGFNDIFGWGIGDRLAGRHQAVIMGHVFDAVVGTRSIGWAYSPALKTVSFDTFFEYINSWGIRRDMLAGLIRRDVFGDAVEATAQAMKEEYKGYSDRGSQQAWCFNLYNRQRFHVAGAAWAMSFGAWPVIPALDRNLLECAGSIPAASIGERRAQCELLCRRFPRLASLPLDRNSHDTTPLKPRLRYQLCQEVKKRLAPIGTLFTGNGDMEDRYYYRIYDFNNPGWSAVREQAETNRQGLYDILDSAALDRYLPRPGVRAELKDRIVDASGMKVLIGLMTWLRKSA